MPFDNTPQTADPTGLAPEHRAKLETLERALRGDMPEDFTWCFGIYHVPQDDCGSVGCALGLAHELGLIKLPEQTCGRHDNAMEQLGLAESAAGRIFYDNKRLYRCKAYYQITPTMVADKLRHFLDTGRVE